jgi:putative membrane protein
MIDMLLSSLHFLLVFALVAILAAQSTLIRPGITVSDLRLAANLDRMYGLSAVLLLGVGFARVFCGTKGSPFYLTNPLFWTKIGFFLIVAILSILPTVQLIRWSKQAHAKPEFLPSEKEVSRLQWWLRAEMIVVVPIPFFAAAMAHGVGLS